MYDRLAEMERDIGSVCAAVEHMKANIDRISKHLDVFENRCIAYETRLTKAAAVVVIVASTISMIVGIILGGRAEAYIYRWLTSHLGG